MLHAQTTDSRAAQRGASDAWSSGGNTFDSVCAAALFSGTEVSQEASHSGRRRDAEHVFSSFVIRRSGFDSPRQLPPTSLHTRPKGPIRSCAIVRQGRFSWPLVSQGVSHDTPPQVCRPPSTSVQSGELRRGPLKDSRSVARFDSGEVALQRVRTPLALLNGTTHVGSPSQIPALIYGVNRVVIASPGTVTSGRTLSAPIASGREADDLRVQAADLRATHKMRTGAIRNGKEQLMTVKPRYAP